MENLTHTSPTPVLLGSTSADKSYPQHAVIFHTVLLILGFLIIINNLTAMCLYWKHKDLQHWSNFLLICLAMSDFLAGFLCIPFLVASSAVALLQSDVYVIYFLSNALSDFVIISNVLILFLIFTERYFSICHPIMTRNFLTFQKIRISVILIWIIAVILSVIPLCWSYRAIAKMPFDIQYMKIMERFNVGHSLFVSISCFILPSVLILFYAVAVMRKICYLRVESRQRKKAVGRKKAFFLLLAMFILLLCAWSPLITVRILLDTGTNVKFTRVALEVIMALRFITSFVNPIIYTLLKDDFRKAFYSLLDTCKPSSVTDEMLLEDNVLNQMKMN